MKKLLMALILIPSLSFGVQGKYLCDIEFDKLKPIKVYLVGNKYLLIWKQYKEKNSFFLPENSPNPCKE